MKKKQRQMIGMLLALVVLAAAFLGIRQYNKNASSATFPPEQKRKRDWKGTSVIITTSPYP